MENINEYKIYIKKTNNLILEEFIKEVIFLAGMFKDITNILIINDTSDIYEYDYKVLVSVSKNKSIYFLHNAYNKKVRQGGYNA